MALRALQSEPDLAEALSALGKIHAWYEWDFVAAEKQLRRAVSLAPNDAEVHWTFGSVLAYTAYTWLLVHAPVSKVATYALVNPVVATFLGALYGESIDVTMLIGAAMIVVSVALVILTESRPTQPTGALEDNPAPPTTA